MAIRGLWLLAWQTLLFGIFSSQSARGDDSRTAAVQGAVVRLLETGFQAGLVSTSELERAYRRGVQESGGPHPYLDYAYAIVLLKNLKQEEAQSHLLAAAESTAPLVLAAREELIRRQLREGAYSEALEALVQLSENVGKVPHAGAEGADAERSATWIGTIVAYLAGPLGNGEIAKQAEIVDRPVRAHLGMEYLPAYESGRNEVGLTYHNFGRQILQASSEAVQKKAEQEEAARQKSEQLAEQRKAAQQAGEQLADVAESDLKDVDAKLTALEKQFAVSLQMETSIQLSQAGLRNQLVLLQRQLGTFQSNQRNFNNRQAALAIQQQIGLAESQLFSLTADYALLLQSRAGLVQLAEDLIAHRQSLASQYGSRAGAAKEQLETIKRWQARVEQTAKKQAAVPVAKMPGVATLNRRMRDLSTYDRRSFEQQRDFLLALMGVAISEEK